MTDSERQPGYLARQTAAFDAGLIPSGKVTECDVKHDDWCLRLHLVGGECGCVPDIVCRYQDDDGATIEVHVP